MQLHRLRDLQDPVAPELAAARDLLRETQPLAPSFARMQRVREALRTRVPPPAAAGTTLIVKAVLLLLAAGVAALILWTRQHQPSRAAVPTRREPAPLTGLTAPQPTPALPHPDAAAPPAARAPLMPPLLTAPSAAPEAAQTTLAPPRRSLHRASRPDLAPQGSRASLRSAPTTPPDEGEPPSRHQHGAAVPAVAQTAASPPDEVRAAVPPTRAALPEPEPAADSPDDVDPAEAALVLSATQLLRQRSEPGRALALLGEYQRRFPRGTLQEEVLALNLECLVALSDHRAGTAAREYLQRYPSGRFRGFAAAAAARYPASSPRQE